MKNISRATTICNRTRMLGINTQENIFTEFNLVSKLTNKVSFNFVNNVSKFNKFVFFVFKRLLMKEIL